MKLTHDGHVFFVDCTYGERHVPRDAKFSWSPSQKLWYTESVSIAARLRDYADESAQNYLHRILIDVKPWAGAIPHPKELSPRPFQMTAAKFALERNRSYLALDPGLGKTICAALIANALKAICVVVCPPHLVRNTYAEFEKWGADCEVLAVPDSMLTKEKSLQDIDAFISTAEKAGRECVLFVDEAHRFKTPTAQRTLALFKNIFPKFDRVVFLSGTPLPNRPIELFPVLNYAAPETIGFRNYFDYGRHFCAGHKNGFGWDFSGHSNMKELSTNVLGKFMLRMKKADVLPELPDKTEELVFIGDGLPADVAALEAEILEEFSPEDLLGSIAPNGHIATYRKELGLLKIEESVKYIKSILSETDESLLIFAHHKDVIAQLQSELAAFEPLVIVGATPMETRHERVKQFQESETHRLFIGNIDAAGTGITLTKATRVIFVEPSWVPAANDQASDRAHRIGQKDNVFVQYLCFADSLDATILKTILSKREVINHI